MVVTAYPALANAFDTDASTVLWVAVAYWVTAVGLLMTLGWLGDVAGRRSVYTAGMGIFAVGMLLSAASFTVWQLIAYRILQGVGSAMVLANVNALITEHFPRTGPRQGPRRIRRGGGTRAHCRPIHRRLSDRPAGLASDLPIRGCLSPLLARRLPGGSCPTTARRAADSTSIR